MNICEVRECGADHIDYWCDTHAMAIKNGATLCDKGRLVQAEQRRREGTSKPKLVPNHTGRQRYEQNTR